MADADEAQEAFSVDLDCLVTTSKVQVVQSVDAHALKKTLQYVLDKLHEKDKPKDKPRANKGPAEILAELGDKDSLRQVVDQLIKENTQLMQDVEELKERARAQEESTASLSDTKAEKDQLPEDLAGRLAALDALDERVLALEAGSKGSPTKEEADDGACITPLGVQPPAVVTAALKRGSADGDGGGDGHGDEGEGVEPPVVNDSALESLSARLAELENQRLADKTEVDEAIKGLLSLVRRASVSNSHEASAVVQGEGPSPSPPASAPMRLNEDGSFDPAELVDTMNRTSASVHELRLHIGLLEAAKADVAALDQLRRQVTGGKLPKGGAAAPARAAPAGSPQPGEQQQQADDVRRPTDSSEVNDFSRAESWGNGGELGGAASFTMFTDAPGDGAMEKQQKALEKAQKMMNQLSQRLDEVELLMFKKPARPAVDLAAAAQAVDSVTSLEELLPRIKELYAVLESKADADYIEALQADLEKLRSSLDSKADREKIESLEATLHNLEAACVSMGAVAGAGADAAHGRVNGGAEVQSEVDVASTDLDGRLRALEKLIRSKADTREMEALKLQIILGGGGDGEGGDNSALIEAIQGMLAKKASRSELEALQSVIEEISEYLNSMPQPDGMEENQADGDGVATVTSRDSDGASGATDSEGNTPSRPLGPPMPRRLGGGDQGNLVTKKELAPLTQTVGDMFVQLEHLSNLFRKLPKEDALPAIMAQKDESASQADGENDGARALKMAMAVAKELTVLQDQLDQVAHATNILGLGLEMGPAGDVTRDGQSDQLAGGADVVCLSNKEPRFSKGAYERLVRFIGRGEIHRKMDWFDPDVLNHLAQKVAGMDSLTRTLATRTGNTTASELGMKELESQLRRVIKEVKSLRDMKVEAAPAPAPNSWGKRTIPEGEHAMLAGKPLLGYKCMACDRPLDKLDDKSGPHLPTHMMPIPIKGPETAPNVSHRPSPALPAINNNQRKKQATYDPAGPRGPQNWYEDQKGAAAEQLPPSDVGPHLPKGGWRANAQSPGPTGRTSHSP